METIKNMPNDARLWVYQSSKELNLEEIEKINALGTQFINQWSAHGASLKASFDVLYNRFIVIAVDEKQANASGCSIDKSVNFMKELEKTFNIQLFDRLQVAYKNTNNKIATCSYSEFEKMAKEGIVSKETVVFNNMVTTKNAFEKEWEVPAKNSWQSRAFA